MNFQNSIKRKIKFLLNQVQLYKKELKSSIKIAMKNKLFCYSKGFLSESYILYDLKNNDYSYFLSDKNRFLNAPNINSMNTSILDNKLIFCILFKNVTEIVKPLSLLRYKEMYLFPKMDRFSSANLDEVVFQLFDTTDNDFILKPICGGGGSGISKITINIKNGKTLLLGLLNNKRIEEGFLLYQKYEQKGFSHNIYPDTLNTLRILTMIDPIDHKPFIAAAVHRFGTEQSEVVDNWSSGGLSASINIENGKLTDAIQFPQNNKLISHIVHPDSFEKIENETVPNWEKIVSTVLDLAKSISFLPYVGWDIVLSDDKILILEANSNSDVNLLQVHEPLLMNPKVKAFYQYYGIL